YRLLVKNQKAVRLGDQNSISELLQKRQLFVTPVRDTLSLFRVQGIGTKFFLAYGECPPDGSLLATVYFAIGPIPLCPVAQYLVRPNDRKPWEILGKAPMSTAYEWWKLGGATAAIALAVAVAVYCASVMAK